ncbi:MAG: hypothetical protein ABI604_03520 [Nitrospirota bacterium]
MRTYRRITDEDRCQMYALHQAGKTQTEIGIALGFSQGDHEPGILPEQGTAGYRVQRAQRKAKSRQEQVWRKLTRRVRRAIGFYRKNRF